MRAFDLVAILEGEHTTPPDTDLQMVPQCGLTAVLTAAPRPLLSLPQSHKQILQHTATRLRWQEACLPLGTLVPVRQNSPLTLQGARDFLVVNQPFLGHLMARFAGFVQVQVTVGWRLDAVLNRFRDSDELAPLFAQGRATPDMLAQAVARLAARLAQQINAMLAMVSVDIAPLPTPAAVLWNGALLVRPDDIGALSATVEAVDAIWSEGMQIRQIGPAPVGSFATLALEPVSVQQIDAARHALGMPASPQVGDLAGARRKLLLGAAQDMHQREHIRLQARIAEGAARLPGGNGGFALAHLWSEGQAADQSPCREVA